MKTDMINSLPHQLCILSDSHALFRCRNGEECNDKENVKPPNLIKPGKLTDPCLPKKALIGRSWADANDTPAAARDPIQKTNNKPVIEKEGNAYVSRQDDTMEIEELSSENIRSVSTPLNQHDADCVAVRSKGLGNVGGQHFNMDGQ